MKPLSTSEWIEEAVKRLRDGELVAIPTETVYGLAADATNEAAIESIFNVKGRPGHNPLIVHVSDIAMAKRYVVWSDQADKLATMHWPGPLTLVLPLKHDSPIAPAVTAGGDTLAVRVPAHPVSHAIIEQLGVGLAAPSANRSGRISPTTAAHVRTEFPNQPIYIVDAGAAKVGIESTVVDCTSSVPRILRAGSIVIEGLQTSELTDNEILKSPGQLASHYAPTLQVRLNAQDVQPHEALLAFGPSPLRGAAHTLNLSEKGDLEEAAANLYAMLRQLDQPDYAEIAVMTIPNEGIGVALNDRLARAAADRGENRD